MGACYVPGWVVLNGSIPGPAGEARHYSCPVAAASQPWINRMLKWWRLIHAGAGSLSSIIPNPSAAAWDAIDTIESEVATIRAAESEERARLAKLKGGR